MHEKYQALIDFIKSLEPDVEKFYTKGQSAAGTRLRKGLSDLKKKAQELRNDIQAVKASRKGAKSEN
ncbi:MAG: histone H1 [Melioribacteraceae bacterium]|nr:histone H1 [Melioribacteraceae bacterium]